MRPQKFNYLVWIYMLCGGILLGACTVASPVNTPGTTVPAPTAEVRIANPASEQCVLQGGSITFETDGGGGQYNVCVFEDSYQCEEWAMFRGDCPASGLRLTGYNTPAARYCAITGGTYTVDEDTTTDADQEQGTCALPDSQSCDVWDYYNGTCGRTSDGAGADLQPQTSDASALDPFAYCADVGTIDEPQGNFGDASNPGVPAAVAVGLRTASGSAGGAPIEMFEQNSYWRCADGQVYACFVGANLPCTEKADTGTTPTDAMTSFCADQPDADAISAAVTGRATVYDWACVDGEAEAGEQIFDVDAQGYLANFWYAIDEAGADE